MPYFYNAFGAEVTAVELLDHILPIEDEEVSKGLEKSFKKQGIKVLTKSLVEGVERVGDKVKAKIKTGDKVTEWTGDCILSAIGVQGNIEGLGLENIVISPEKSYIEVDEFYQTGVPGVYAIGDIVGAPWLAHVASHEGIIAAEHLAGQSPHAMDYERDSRLHLLPTSSCLDGFYWRK